MTDNERDRLLPLMRSVDAVANRYGSLRAAARVLGVDVGYLSRMRSGKKSNPSKTLMHRLGIRREIRFYWKADGLIISRPPNK